MPQTRPLVSPTSARIVTARITRIPGPTRSEASGTRVAGDGCPSPLARRAVHDILLPVVVWLRGLIHEPCRRRRPVCESDFQSAPTFLQVQEIQNVRPTRCL